MCRQRPVVQLDEDTNTVTSPDTSYLGEDAAQQVAQKVTGIREQVTKVLTEGAEVDGELGHAIAQATGVPPAASGTPKTLQELLLPGVTPHQTPPPTGQRSNQAAAFREVSGHDPVTSNDWQMAAALDPHSYDPRYLGKPPQIVAGGFSPQPGRGNVRSNMFIPTDQVQNTFEDGADILNGRPAPMNYGDNRGPSADASVGAYEFPPAAAAGMTVNGRVTVVPHTDGTVGIGGNTTVYRSMETYQYRDGAPPAQLLWNPANSGSEWVRGPA